jgi:hypothetical protein
MRFPNHAASLTLEHNDHKGIYQSAADWIADNEMFDWRDDAAKQRAIETDSIWTLMWYPDTPVGSYDIAAPTLEEVLEWAAEIESRDAK